MMTEYIKEERTVIFGKVFQHYSKSIWQEVRVILYEIYFEICEDAKSRCRVESLRLSVIVNHRKGYLRIQIYQCFINEKIK